MANSYTNTTGVLVLEKVTPLITALFGAFSMDPASPGNGQVYIASIAGKAEPTWTDIHERLAALMVELGVQRTGDTEETVAMDLFALAEHYKIDDPEFFRVLDSLTFDECESPDLQVLLDLANWLDDGHGLKAIKLESSWGSDKPNLFEFGGAGEYFGRHISVRSASAAALSIGEELDAALEAGNLDAVAARFVAQIGGILNGLTDASIADPLRVKLGRSLIESYGKLETGSPAWFEATFGSEHPACPKSAWRSEVANDHTVLGYWEWVSHSVEGAEASAPDTQRG